ncbi:flagellar biosynthetic protein FliR [Desulfobotulus sp. H1]|uniref:Flagellar biosynthetic protein FliR n=1 Tax=Desulfobotulus pelophilus TaxID=2823377 RepID=A0ABT3N8M4_9BACT|nr:flagellar biosynthetic protein FliR [Desulfobotulus pelophilus]MCW7753802.1 flagellar biosynthetic protein FliR [Desulfobotulus pelophilus]
MEILNLFSPDEMRHFLLVLTRVSVILFLFPFFGSESFPVLVKAGLALSITLVLFSTVVTDPVQFPDKVLMAPILLVSELFVGMVIALVVRLFFGAVQLAGLLIGFQMGFSMINVMDPQTGSQVSVMEQLGYWTVIVVFILLDGHYILLKALVESFHMVPPGGFALPEIFLDHMMKMTAAMFVTGIKIGAPAIVALLFVSVAFGITAKFAPQMNVLIISFPVKIAIGLIFFGAVFEVIVRFARAYVQDFPGMLHLVLRMFGSG